MSDSSPHYPRDVKQVMASSTFTDLIEHRAALISALSSYRLHPNVMEHDSARLVDVIDSSLQMVRDSAAYIGLISLKYGQTPVDADRNPDKVSITELEFNEAQRLGRPILLFVMGDHHRVTKNDVEKVRKKEKKLNAFRERAKKFAAGSSVNRVYAVFNSLEEFKVMIGPPLSELSHRLATASSVAPKSVAATHPSSAPTTEAAFLESLDDYLKIAKAIGHEVSVARRDLKDGPPASLIPPTQPTDERLLKSWEAIDVRIDSLARMHEKAADDLFAFRHNYSPQSLCPNGSPASIGMMASQMDGSIRRIKATIAADQILHAPRVLPSINPAISPSSAIGLFHAEYGEGPADHKHQWRDVTDSGERLAAKVERLLSLPDPVETNFRNLDLPDLVQGTRKKLILKFVDGRVLSISDGLPLILSSAVPINTEPTIKARTMPSNQSEILGELSSCPCKFRVVRVGFEDDKECAGFAELIAITLMKIGWSGTIHPQNVPINLTEVGMYAGVSLFNFGGRQMESLVALQKAMGRSHIRLASPYIRPTFLEIHDDIIEIIVGPNPG